MSEATTTTTTPDTFNGFEVVCRHKFKPAAQRCIVGSVLVKDPYNQGEHRLWSECKGWPDCEGFDGRYNLSHFAACEELAHRYIMYSHTVERWYESYGMSRNEWVQVLDLSTAREWLRASDKLNFIAMHIPNFSSILASQDFGENPHSRLEAEVEDLYVCMLRINRLLGPDEDPRD